MIDLNLFAHRQFIRPVGKVAEPSLTTPDKPSFQREVRR